MRLAVAAMLLAAPAAAQAPERVRCVVDHGPAQDCRVTFSTAGGVRTLRFDMVGGRRVTFVGRAQTGWWSGRLDGKPAMGFERNRGNVAFATSDLAHSFEWYYPDSEHGRY
ncbi:MAG TPA: hypothetical protein DEP91_05365 [Sphingomonas bacterium]|uniref:Uncharacterized protein n=1 Tax=Sphingomonas bacterium TaxID=1895847 RepID=A0A3D0WAM5_9SPHN|nr:hypothetical protein [Sphingomonas bacterium]